MLAIPALYVQCGGFGRKSRGTDDDARYSNEVGDVCSVEVAYGDLRDGRMKEKLMFGEVDVVGFLGWEDDTMCALFQCCFKLERFSIDRTCKIIQGIPGE